MYPEQITITAVKDGTGQVTLHVAVLRDITERKRLEQEVPVGVFRRLDAVAQPALVR